MKREKIKKIVLIIIAVVVSSTITSYATSNILYNSENVSYDNVTSKVEAETVQGAIDELYNLANIAKKECPNGKVCIDYICKRATSLNSENGITYGTIGSGSTLTAGEALDCKVSTSGDYTERFYYITDLESNSNYAVLLYNQNTSTNNVAFYSSANENWHGPITAVQYLPTTTQWDNLDLASSTRQLYATSDMNTYVTTTNNGSNNLGTYSYAGYAGRLLTIKELKQACPGASTTNGSLSSCTYLMENTKYGDSTSNTCGYWLETPIASYSDFVWYVAGDVRQVNYSNTVNSIYFGARPVIEVPKKLIKLD